MPAAIVDRFLRGDRGLGAVDTEAELELPVRDSEEQEVAVAAIVKVEDRSGHRTRLS